MISHEPVVGESRFTTLKDPYPSPVSVTLEMETKTCDYQLFDNTLLAKLNSFFTVLEQDLM